MKIFIWGWVDYKEFSFSTFMLILDASFKRACINFASIKVKERNSNACTLLLRPSIQEKLEWKEERRFKTFYYCCGSVTKSCPTLCSPMNCSTPGFPVLNYLPQFAQTHVHWVSDAIQPSHPLSPPSLALNLSQHQGLFQWVGSSHKLFLLFLLWKMTNKSKNHIE